MATTQRRQPHTDLVKAALKELAFEGVAAWQNNTGRLRSPDGERRVDAGLVGSADILGFMPAASKFPGHILAAEAKIPPDKLSLSQARFLLTVNEAGGVAFVFHSIAELQGHLREAGVEIRINDV